MPSEIRESRVSGVWLEFRDPLGHSLGQTVFADWHGRPLPNVGDTVTAPGKSADATLRGQVVSRHFEIQRTDNGQPEVWVYLVIQRTPRRRAQLLCLQN